MTETLYLEQYVLPEGINPDDYVVATYLFRSREKDILQRVATMAAEQTTGTWIQVPDETNQLKERHQGKVLGIWEVPDYETDRQITGEERTHVFQLAYPVENIGSQIPMLLTTVFGNISMMGEIKLVDLSLPRKFVDGLPGPQFGVKGIRKLLGVPERPLLNTMIKPSTGITPEKGAELFYQAGLGGTDIIKDDEVLADTGFSPFLRRVELYLRMAKRAHEETGQKILYAVNVTDEPERCLNKAIAAVEAGANAIMVNYLPAGIGILSSLARNPKIRVPILAHLDFGGALYASPFHGISSHLIYGKLARLAGVDMLTIPTPYGKFWILRDKYLRIAVALQKPAYDKERAWPIAGGAVKQGHLPQLFKDLGKDFIVGAGGAIYAHPMGPSAGARAFRQGIDLMMKRGGFDESVEDYPELKVALDQWGIYGKG
jgi:2,3-diketo-5-methylthiopentyl-1-phosphate enolase